MMNTKNMKKIMKIYENSSIYNDTDISDNDTDSDNYISDSDK